MFTDEYIQKTGMKVICKGGNKKILNAYAGDFLSFVMGRAKDSCVWFTVMNNVNVAGVAYLIDCACVVLCEDVTADKNLIEKCIQQGIILLGTNKTVYEACAQFSRL